MLAVVVRKPTTGPLLSAGHARFSGHRPESGEKYSAASAPSRQ